MKTITRKKTVLIFFILEIFLANAFLISFYGNFNASKIKSEIDSINISKIDQLIPKEKGSLKNAGYSNNQRGIGETDLDVDLYQSILDATPKNFPNISASNSFAEPFPKDFQNVFTNISIDNIYAPNKTLNIEPIVDGPWPITTWFYTSLRVVDTCFLENISINLQSASGGTVWTIDLYNATFLAGYLTPDKDITGGLENLGQVSDSTATDKWFSLTNRHRTLDIGKTYQRYFFIQVSASASGSRWNYENEHNNIDDTVSWGASSIPESKVDFTLKIGLSPVDNTPSPSEIGLKVNNTAVGNIVDTQGYWNKTTPFTANSGNVTFNITSNWYDVSCRVSQVKINYTDTMNLKATSTFDASLEETNIAWNVTCNPLNFFDSRVEDYNVINFTIPDNWDLSSIKVWNNSKSYSYITVGIGNGYVKVIVANAGNGTWWLTVNSTNLIDAIKIYVNSIETDTVFYSDDVQINATFSNSINQDDGEINMSIYNFDSPNYENHSVDLTNFESGTEISIDIWHVQNDVTNYGLLKIQVFWGNKSAAGIKQKIIKVVGNTQLEPINSESDQEFYDDETFNITIFYKDSGKSNIGIGNARIFNNSKEIASPVTNSTEGYYFVPVNTSYYPYGLNEIVIATNKTYYQNQTLHFAFYKVIKTQIKPENSKILPAIYRGDIIPYAFNYSDIEGKVVNNANSDIIGNDYEFEWNCTQKGANSNYTIWLNSTHVANGGSFTLLFNVSAKGNETQEIQLQITVLLPNTKIDLATNIVDLQVPIGRNITLNFNFTDDYKRIPIETINRNNVTIEYLVGGTTWEPFNLTYGGDPNFTNGAWELYYHGDGNYTLRVTTKKLDNGNRYTIRIIISYASPNPGPYKSSIFNVTNFLYGTIAPITLNESNGGGGGGGGNTTITGFTWGQILLWIIIAACVGGSVASIVGIKKGVIAPRKRERERVLREVTTVFDDAVNLEHLLVIYKDMGACIFFKSLGLEEIDPQLVSGFLSAVSSFGKEMDSQEALNEIQYGDKMLLLADGQYIRVALVLDKHASTILRQHLKEFIQFFENYHSNDLPNWKGKINMFKDTGNIVDNIFHTSIALPHEIKYDLSKVKSLKISCSKEVLKVAQGIVKGSERKYFFIASLLTEAVDKTGRDKAEIFMSIKELTETGILIPTPVSVLEEKEMSQHQLNLIRQKVGELSGLSEEEIDNIANELAKLNHAEREAYLTSYKKKTKIVSAPIKSKSGAKVIDNDKSAKKEIKILKKLAAEKIRQEDVAKAVEIYRSASAIAINWGLTKEADSIENIIRLAQINDLRELKNILENKARTAEITNDNKTAVDKYNQASKIASEIFKLGITEMTKEIKKLTKKAKELEKKS